MLRSSILLLSTLALGGGIAMAGPMVQPAAKVLVAPLPSKAALKPAEARPVDPERRRAKHPSHADKHEQAVDRRQRRGKSGLGHKGKARAVGHQKARGQGHQKARGKGHSRHGCSEADALH
jgi:hypothetical protein